MSKELLNVIDKIQQVLAVDSNNNHLQVGRTLAYEYLKMRTWSDQDQLLLDKFEVIKRLEKYYISLKDNGGIGASDNDYIGATCVKQCNYNFLSFDEIDEPTLYQKYVFENISENSDLMLLINLCVTSSGGVLYLYDDERPDTIVNLKQFKALPIGFVLVVIADTNARAQVLYHGVSGDEVLHWCRVYADDRSELDYVYLHNYEKGQPLVGHDFSLDGNAKLKFYNLVLEGRGYVTALANCNGIQSDFINSSLLLSSKDDYLYYRHLVNHLEFETSSDVLIKGIVLDQANINIYGGIVMGETMQHIDAKIKHDFIHWGEAVKIKIDPIIETNNDNKIIESSSVTKVSEDAMSYQISQGLSEEAAKIKIANEFTKDIIDASLSEDIKKIIMEKINKHIKN